MAFDWAHGLIDDWLATLNEDDPHVRVLGFERLERELERMAELSRSMNRSVSTILRHFPFAFSEQSPVWKPATTSS
jgi:hypothetical protein